MTKSNASCARSCKGDKEKRAKCPPFMKKQNESGFNYANPPAKYPMTEKRMYIIPTKT